MHDAPHLSLLVVEDNPDLAANIADYLEAKGHLVDVAMDGVTGLHLAVSQPHDVVVLDLMLPGLDGLSVCRRLRRDAQSPVPVLMRTALAVILSTTEVLLGDDSLTDKQKARIGRIERAARDMAELGTALLLMSREEHSLAMGGGCVVAEVVREVVEKHRHMLGGKPVTVEVHTNPDLILQADAGVVEILVSNLVRNAFAYTASRLGGGAPGRPRPHRHRHRQGHPRPRRRAGLHPPLPRHGQRRRRHRLLPGQAHLRPLRLAGQAGKRRGAGDDGDGGVWLRGLAN